MIWASVYETAHPDALGIIDAGNAGMASGGMGDVLSGIIGALLGQKLSPYDAKEENGREAQVNAWLTSQHW